MILNVVLSLHQAHFQNKGHHTIPSYSSKSAHSFSSSLCGGADAKSRWRKREKKASMCMWRITVAIRMMNHYYQIIMNKLTNVVKDIHARGS